MVNKSTEAVKAIAFEVCADAANMNNGFPFRGEMAQRAQTLAHTAMALASERDALRVQADKLNMRVANQSRMLEAAEQALATARANAAERRTFPILGTNGARIDYQLVVDHGAQAKRNHSQTVDRLAERGGLSWAELRAVLHNRPFQKMEQNEAITECRALEAKYIAALLGNPAPAPAQRCAECDCENGGNDCNWIAPAPAPTLEPMPSGVAAALADRESLYESDGIAPTEADPAKLVRAAQILLESDESGSRSEVYAACEGKVKVYKFDAVLRALSEPKP